MPEHDSLHLSAFTFMPDTFITPGTEMLAFLARMATPLSILATPLFVMFTSPALMSSAENVTTPWFFKVNALEVELNVPKSISAWPLLLISTSAEAVMPLASRLRMPEFDTLVICGRVTNSSVFMLLPSML